jgi:hypothetical protein
MADEIFVKPRKGDVVVGQFLFQVEPQILGIDDGQKL